MGTLLRVWRSGDLSKQYTRWLDFTNCDHFKARVAHLPRFAFSCNICIRVPIIFYISSAGTDVSKYFHFGTLTVPGVNSQPSSQLAKHN